MYKEWYVTWKGEVVIERENELALHQPEKRMIRWMCSVTLKDKVSYVDFRQQLRTDDIVKAVQRNRLPDCNGMDLL